MKKRISTSNAGKEQTQREQTLGELLTELWHARIFILTGLTCGLVLAITILALSIPHHQASITLSPATPMGLAASNSTAQNAQNTGTGSSARQPALLFTHFQSMYKGASVAALLLRDEDIKQGLTQDKAFTFSKEQTDWTPAKLAAYIENRIIIDPIGETELRIFSYQHTNPNFAALFLKRLHQTTDGLIQYALRKDISQRIAYLNKALSQTKNPEHRRTFTALLMEQERLKMLISIEQSYAAFIVEPAATQARIAWPSPALLLSAFLFCGAFLGFSLYSIRNAQSAPRNIQQPERPQTLQTRAQPRKMRDWIHQDSQNNNTRQKRTPFSMSKPPKQQ